MSQLNDFKQFLSYTASQREVSLVIAQDDDELRSLEEQLREANFIQAARLSNLLDRVTEPSKIFMLADQFKKDLYDFIAQYPTGQVEIFDAGKMQSTVISPQYQDSAIILLITKDQLSVIRQQGFDILPLVGLTYQSV